MYPQAVIQKKLHEKLTEIRFRNPSYSMRAFSRKIGMSSSAVSEILNGKRSISRKLTQRIIERLSLSPMEAQELLSLYPVKDSDRSAHDKKARSDGYSPRQAMRLSMDQYHVIADWYHFAILSLAETDGFRSDSEWIARRLNIPVRDARAGIERLLRLGLLCRQNRQLMVTGKNYTTTDEIVNLSLRKSQAQSLDLARASLEQDPIEARDITTMTMAIDPAKLPEAKKMLREMRERVCTRLEGGKKKEVYQLCIQLIPLTKDAGGA